jgi:hypothetical protein
MNKEKDRAQREEGENRDKSLTAYSLFIDSSSFIIP